MASTEGAQIDGYLGELGMLDTPGAEELRASVAAALRALLARIQDCCGPAIAARRAEAESLEAQIDACLADIERSNALVATVQRGAATTMVGCARRQTTYASRVRILRQVLTELHACRDRFCAE